ncbi:Hypothetical predicted protein [Pelobates cultripes]|uniref:Uncharacterized protein n=1 Tax=Pelobates cultripes TaxID=61616 RepID=A0AAD1VJM5_PELCU|nr:Hypothetical predicted protein [Pelobates cultripes]
MAEQALYPGIAVAYFGLLSWESRGDRLELGPAASVNVLCLFVLAQPLCLVIGGYMGAFIYLSMALMSYACLTRKGAETVKKRKEGTKKKSDIATENVSGERKKVKKEQRNGNKKED